MAFLGSFVGVGRVAVIVSGVMLPGVVGLLFIRMGWHCLGSCALHVAAIAVGMVDLKGLKVVHKFIAQALSHLGPMNGLGTG